MSISPKNEASQNNTAKRRDYISWDEYFMGIAMLSAMRSKDPNSQVGACIVRDNKILSLEFIKKHERNPRKSWECERMRAAIPYLERIGM